MDHIIDQPKIKQIDEYLNSLFDRSKIDLNPSKINDNFLINQSFSNPSFKIDTYQSNSSKITNLTNLSDYKLPDIDFLATTYTQPNDKLILPPSCFPEGCVCGHLHEFRNIGFKQQISRTCSLQSRKLNVNPINIKLRSAK